MDNLIDELSRIEKELVALSGNQPPNPSQIGTYRIDRTTTVLNETKTVVFSGLPQYIQVFNTTPGSYVGIEYVGGNITINVAGSSGTTYSVVSLGDFSLV
jgi:hypothetical protein